MTKKEITYIGLVSHMLKKARDDAVSAGKKLEQTSVMRSAGERWKSVKSGVDPEFSQGNKKKTNKKTSDTEDVKQTSSNLTSHPKTAQDVLDMVDLCEDCKSKIEGVLNKTKKNMNKSKKKRSSKKKK
tara:strand:+ start:1677 stop:2060 length:384 start_codon:yes stop_codon:yes gene_type:complete